MSFLPCDNRKDAQTNNSSAWIYFAGSLVVLINPIEITIFLPSPTGVGITHLLSYRDLVILSRKTTNLLVIGGTEQ